MKKQVSCIMIIAALALVSGAAHALPGVTIDAGVTLPMPSGDFSDSFKPGFGAAADAFVGIPLSGLQFGGRIGYNSFGAEDDFDDGSMSIIEILPSVRYSLSAPLGMVSLFGQLGLGMYAWNSELDMGGVTVEDDGTDFGFALGVGASARVTPTMKLFLMPMYHSIQTEDDATNYTTLHIGIMF